MGMKIFLQMKCAVNVKNGLIVLETMKYVAVITRVQSVNEIHVRFTIALMEHPALTEMEWQLAFVPKDFRELNVKIRIMEFAPMNEEGLEEGAIVPMPLAGLKWEAGRSDVITLDV